MAQLTVVLPHSYDDENDRIAKRIVKSTIGNRLYLLSTCECCGALHITVTNLPRQNVMPYGIMLQENLLRQNIDADIIMDTNKPEDQQIIAN